MERRRRARGPQRASQQSAVTRALMHLGTLSPYGMAQFGQPHPSAERAPTWRDDEAFAAVVAPLARDLGWRLRVRRLALGAATRPVARVVGVVAGVVAVGAGAALGASLLVATIADAWASPLRMAL